MFGRRSPLRMIALVGFGLLLGAMLFGGTTTVESLVAAPLVILGFMFKVALFLFIFGFFAKMFGGRHHGHYGSAEDWEKMRKRWESRHGASRDEAPSENDRFDEWHRMAHARQEVDDHVPPVEG